MKPNACPWCDSETIVTCEEAEDESITYHFIECEECGAQGPIIGRDGKPMTPAEAIAFWNEVAP